MSTLLPPAPTRRRKRARAVRPKVDRLESRVVPASFIVNWFIKSGPGAG